jgi:hypothetical protein
MCCQEERQNLPSRGRDQWQTHTSNLEGSGGLQRWQMGIVHWATILPSLPPRRVKGPVRVEAPGKYFRMVAHQIVVVRRARLGWPDVAPWLEWLIWPGWRWLWRTVAHAEICGRQFLFYLEPLERSGNSNGFHD